MTGGTNSSGYGAEEYPNTQGAHAARRDELCLMPLSDRLAHFARRRAYQMPDGKALRIQPQQLPKLNASGFTRDAAGVFHLTKPVVGLPCLGIPTARYLHGRRDYLIGETGKVHLTRCHRCELKDLCGRMCDELLHHSGDAVYAAWQRFMEYGGWSAVVQGWARKDGRGSPAAAQLRELLQELQAAGVMFANDADVRDYIERRTAEAKANAAERQRRSRLKRKMERESRLNGGSVDLDALVVRSSALRDDVRSAQEEPGCPRWLAGVDATFAARVYAAKDLLIARGEKNGATHIARLLARATPEIGHDALRKKVSRVLKALQRIEALP